MFALGHPGARAGDHPEAPGDELAADAVRIGVQKQAFPFAFYRADRKPQYLGYAVDLCIEIVKGWRMRQGRTLDPERDIQWVEVTPRTRLMKLIAGEIDLECGSTSNTAKRRELGIAFSPTYFVSNVGMLLRPELAPRMRPRWWVCSSICDHRARRSSRRRAARR